MDTPIKGSTRVTLGAIGLGAGAIGFIITCIVALSYIWIPIFVIIVSIVVYDNGLSKNPPE